MDSKMLTLIEKLNLTEECKNSLESAKLTKIVGNLEKTNYCFYIEINEMLNIENYLEFTSKLKKSFPNIDSVNVVFNVNNKNYDIIVDYFKEIINILSKESSMLSMFIDNKVEYVNNILKILLHQQKFLYLNCQIQSY